MSENTNPASNIEIAREYFKRLDARNPDVLKLFTDDVVFYYPKFGIGKGPNAVLEAMMGLGGIVERTEHDFATYVLIASENRLAVEGTTKGVLKNQERWAGGETPTGRFCNVFEFRDGLISRLHIYLDPDYEGKFTEGFRWGREGRSW